MNVTLQRYKTRIINQIISVEDEFAEQAKFWQNNLSLASDDEAKAQCQEKMQALQTDPKFWFDALFVCQDETSREKCIRKVIEYHTVSGETDLEDDFNAYLKRGGVCDDLAKDLQFALKPQ